MELEKALSSVRNTIENHAAEIIEIGDHVWNNPEPGYREVETSAYLAGKLEKLGLNVKTGLAMTGFRADIDTGRPGPVLAVLGELDSLILPNHPECNKKTGAVHACGHNASCASLYGTALACMVAVVVFLIFIFNYYIGIVKSEPFLPKFAEMAGISLSVALIAFLIGWGAKVFFNLDIG